MKNGVGRWTRDWDHVEEVYAIKFQGQDFEELYCIESSAPTDLKQEWIDFCSVISYIWYYGVVRCDEIRMESLMKANHMTSSGWMPKPRLLNES